MLGLIQQLKDAHQLDTQQKEALNILFKNVSAKNQILELEMMDSNQQLKAVNEMQGAFIKSFDAVIDFQPEKLNAQVQQIKQLLKELN